jgi:hypothetical protein
MYTTGTGSLCFFPYMQVLNVRTPENDVLVDFSRGCDLWSIEPAALGTERTHVLQRHSRLLRVDGIESTLVPDFRFRNEADA